MRRKLFLAGIGAILALSYGCEGARVTTPTAVATLVGSGLVVTESRPVSGFTALTVTGPLRVIVEQTGDASLRITADDNVLPLVESEVRGGRLRLGFAPHQASLTLTRDVVCRVTTGPVRDLEASGAARVEVTGIDVDRLGVHLSGAAIGAAAGAAEHVTLDVSAASRWSAAELSSRVVTAEVSGASYALVRAADSLVATVSGASVLEYVGDPVVTPTVSGVSVLRRVGP